MSDSVQPHRWQLTRLPRPWDSPGKNTGVGCHFLLQCMKVKSEVAQSCPLLATPWTAAYHAPLPMGFSRQEYWSGVPLSSPVRYIEISKTSVTTRDWLTRLWRQRSPAVCCLQAGGPGKWMVCFSFRAKVPENQGRQWCKSSLSPKE